MVEEFGVDEDGDIENGFVVSMKYLCGTYATIKTIKKNGDIELNDFSVEGDTFWFYSINMIKPVKMNYKIR